MSASSYFDQVRRLFHEAAALPVVDRAGYVDRACADDPALRADLTELLRAHDEAGAFLESPIVASALTWDRTSGGRTSSAAEPSWEGRVLAQYRLEERLASGGMGVVYRATDIALGRPAAVKVLPYEFALGLRERLRSEGAASARLQHPAIATYYESGDDEGTVFIAMEYVRGLTLRARLATGPLPEDEAVAVIECVLEALNHAHAAGVLHRDIKPENIILTGERRAKLLDFGIAKLLTGPGPSEETSAAMTGASLVGTIGYMSPEQIRNDSLDARSDVFQVAAVLYEMLTGRPAFPGRTAAQRLAAVLTATPPLDGVMGGERLMAALQRALSRDASVRTASAAAFLSDLRAARGDAVARLPQTIGILDFQNLSDTVDDDWIGSGLAESLAADLSRARGFVVLPRSRVMQALRAAPSDDGGRDAVRIGSELGCRWVLTGDYRRLGPALRLHTSLVEVPTGRIVGRDQFDGAVADIFQFQDRIIAALGDRVDASTVGSSVPRPVVSAYECYARGRRLMEGLGRDGLRQAREWFERAVELDAQYAEALAGLAQIHGLHYTFTTDLAALETALAAANRARAADPKLAEAEIWGGYALLRLERFDEADAAFARARELNPSLMFGYYFAAGPTWTRNPDRAIGLLQQAIRLAPMAGNAWATLGSIFFGLARYTEALSCFTRGKAVSGPGAMPVPGIQGYAAECYRMMGRVADARRESLEGLDAVEGSDHIYRDTVRVTCLLAYARAAIADADRAAANAALSQALAHVRGRVKMTAGGTLLVRALAAQALLGDRLAYDEARELAEHRRTYNFSWYWLCDGFLMYQDLAAAAHAAGDSDAAQAFDARARASGPASDPREAHEAN